MTGCSDESPIQVIESLSPQKCTYDRAKRHSDQHSLCSISSLCSNDNLQAEHQTELTAKIKQDQEKCEGSGGQQRHLKKVAECMKRKVMEDHKEH